MRAVDAGGAVVGQERWQTSPDKSWRAVPLAALDDLPSAPCLFLVSRRRCHRGAFLSCRFLLASIQSLLCRLQP